jgi:hypothetical protein
MARIQASQVDPRFRYQGCQAGNEVQWLDKIAGSDLEQPQAGPKGGGQDARRNMTCMVPPRYGVFSWYRRLPFGVTDRRFSAMAGRLMYLHNRSSFWRRSARAATPACRKNPATLPAASAV